MVWDALLADSETARRVVENGSMANDSRDLWSAVDEYVEQTVARNDEALEAAMKANVSAGLQNIDVTASQGKFLHVLALAKGAKRILELGTLGGYSTIWLA